MARLPQPGSDEGQWGTILNDFLLQSLSPDGSLIDASIVEAKLSPAVQSKLNAVGSGGVVSVNGQTGVVTLAKSDIALGNVDNTSDANKPISTATQTALNTKEPTVTAGTTSQFYRGDKTWQPLPAAPVTSVNTQTGAVVLAKGDVGLGNVDNTSDANKPVSTAAQTALNLKANLASPTFTGTVTVPAPSSGTDAATKTYVDNAVTGGATPDATTLVKGKIQLAGDLAGTAALPTVPGLAGKEPTIAAGTTSQYYRGDKSFQILDKTAVGLANVDNTSDANKPVSTAQATADGLRVLKSGDTMTGDLNIPSNRLGVGLTNSGSASIEAASDVSHQGVRVQGAGASNLAYSAFVGGDAQLRYLVSNGGEIDWSDGSSSVDTSLARTGAGELTVNNKLTTTSLKVTGGTLGSGKVLTSDVSGNATWQTVDKTTVGLGNVDNTSDANKPVSTATQTALDLKADASTVGVKTLLINTAGDLPAGTPAGVIVVVKS